MMARRIVGRTSPGEEITVEFDAPDSMYEDAVVEQLAITIPVIDIVETRIRGNHDGGTLAWYAGNPHGDSVARRIGLNYIQQLHLRMSDAFVDAVNALNIPQEDKDPILKSHELLKQAARQVENKDHPLDKVMFLDHDEEVTSVLELIKSLGGDRTDRLVIMLEDDYDRACEACE